MIAAAIVFVKPITRSHWPILARVSFYIISGMLFLSIILFEYFTKVNLSDIVRDTIGSAVCYIFPVNACPAVTRELANPAISPRDTKKTLSQPSVPSREFSAELPEGELRSRPSSLGPTLPPSGDIRCNAMADGLQCQAFSDCTWIAALMDAKTGKEKRKAYCKTKAKPPAQRTEDVAKK